MKWCACVASRTCGELSGESSGVEECRDRRMGSVAVALPPTGVNGECGGVDEAGDEAPNSGAPQRRQAKHDSGVADLERVTDYAEEKEISSQDILGVRHLSHRLCCVVAQIPDRNTDRFFVFRPYPWLETADQKRLWKKLNEKKSCAKLQFWKNT